MFQRIGTFATRYHRQIVLFWVGLAVVITLVAPSIDDVASSDQKDFLPANAPYEKGDELYKAAFPDQYAEGSSYIVIDASKDGGIDAPATWSFIADLETWLNSEDAPSNIAAVKAPTTNPLAPKLLVSDDGQLALVSVDFTTGHISTETADALADIDAWIEDHLPANVEAYQTGGSPIVIDTDKSIRTSVDRTIWVTVVLVVVLLLAIYRSPVSPLIPLVTVTLSYFVTRGLVAWVGDNFFTITSYVKVLMVVVLYGAGTDYCLFLISRFREEMADKPTVEHATSSTVALVGETITSSAATIFVGFMAMAFAEMGLFNTTGPALAIGIAVMLLAGLTLTPALLALIGEKAFWPGKATHRSESRFYTRVSNLVSAHPGRIALIILVVMVPFSIYAYTLNFNYNSVEDMPSDRNAVIGFNKVGEHMNEGDTLPLNVVVTGRDPQTMASDIASLTAELAALDGISSVRGMNSPFGQNEDYEGLLRVDTQLTLLSEGLTEALTAAQSSDEGLDPAEALSMLSGVQNYLAALGEQFPIITEDANYQALMGAIQTLNGLQRVDGQLALVQNLLTSGDTDLSSIDATMLPALLKAAQGYSALLGERFPAIVDDPNYIALQDIMSNPLTMLGRMDDLDGALTGLIATFAAMDDASLPISDLLALAEPLQEQGASLLIEQASALTGAIDGLAATFATLDDAYIMPTVGGDLFAALDPIYDLYLADDGTAYRLQVVLDGIPTSYSAMDAVSAVRDVVATYARPGADAQVSGEAAMVTDIRDTMNSDQIRAIGLVLAGTFIVLLLMLRSLIAPFVLLLAVILAYTTSLGISSLVFKLVGIDQLTFWMPFFTFVFLVALGIDYNIFLMGRVKEEVARHGIREGVHITVRMTGPIIGSAGIILAGTFLAMMAGEIKGLIEIGFAVSLGVLLEAFIGVAMLVPALITLLGKWAWWPRHLDSQPAETAPQGVPAHGTGD